MGNMVALEGGAMENGLSVCAGVPKAGEEEGIGFEDSGAGVLGGNIEAVRGPLLFCILLDYSLRGPEGRVGLRQWLMTFAVE